MIDDNSESLNFFILDSYCVVKNLELNNKRISFQIFQNFY